MFKNDSARFNEWLRKTQAYVLACFGHSFKQVLEWIEDQDSEITLQDLIVEFGPESELPVADLEERDSQLHTALMSLTEGESFDLVLGSGGRGADALRRLIRRWDPASGGKRRVILKQILVPERAKLQDLPQALERWDELVRRYEKRRAGGSAAQSLDGDVKVAALEALVPHELEQHLALHRARLSNYSLVRAEVDGYIDAKVSQSAILGGKPRKTAESTAMDVDSLQKKGKGKGNNKGNHHDNNSNKQSKKDVECYNCGKKGHYARDCWSQPKQATPHQPRAKAKAGGKGKKKSSKAAGSLDAEGPEDAEEVVPEETSYLELCGLTDSDCWFFALYR